MSGVAVIAPVDAREPKSIGSHATPGIRARCLNKLLLVGADGGEAVPDLLGHEAQLKITERC